MSDPKIVLCLGGGRKRPQQTQRGVVFIFSNKDDTILEVVSKKDKFYIHKQFEIKNGLLFMRLKKRSNPVHA